MRPTWLRYSALAYSRYATRLVPCQPSANPTEGLTTLFAPEPLIEMVPQGTAKKPKFVLSRRDSSKAREEFSPPSNPQAQPRPLLRRGEIGQLAIELQFKAFVDELAHFGAGLHA